MKKIIWIALTFLIAMSLILSSCGGEEEEEETEVTIPTEEPEVTVPTEEPEVTVPESGEWWQQWGTPTYGGTYTILATREPTGWDPYFGAYGGYYLEHIAAMGWMEVPPDVWDFRTRFQPIDYLIPLLAESWEIQNWDTMVFHIRKGVHWQNIAPVNGRELTAYDVEYSWHRVFGLGSGFTEPTPWTNYRQYGPPTSVEATDKYTVVMKLPTASFSWCRMFLDDTPYIYVVPHEVIEKYGDMNDWEHCVGSGPWIMADYVAGSSLTYNKNPDYWGYDEKYPQNRLPYLDRVKELIIPDQSTRIAALRTGKLDVISRLNWEQAEKIKETNPELIPDSYASGTMTLVYDLSLDHFSDIRVRKAMQMSLDLQTIADTYYGGYVDGTPVGHTYFKGYRAEYADWPQEVKDGFAYNPEGAKALLAEAGYPNGFQCTLTASATQDLDLLQIIQAYLLDIGIDMQIQVFESPTWRSYIYAGKAEMTTASWGAYSTIFTPDRLYQLTSTHRDAVIHHISDPVYEDMVATVKSTVDPEEIKRLCVEADLYAISKFWEMTVQPIPSFGFSQPWLRRYLPTGDVLRGYKQARIWIDQEMKEAMR